MDAYARLASLLGENADEEVLRRMFSPVEALALTLAGEGGTEAGAVAARLGPGGGRLLEDLYRAGYLERDGRRHALSAWRDVLYQFLLSPRYARYDEAGREIFRRRFLERNLRRFREAEQALFRVLPAGGTLAHLDLHVVVPYTVAAEVLARAGKVAVIDCVCRVTVGNCESPRDVCLALGDATGYYLERGLGRALDQEQAQAVLARAAGAGLVHCMDNPAMRQPARVICSCCECCCVFVRGLKEHRLPRTIVSAGYLALTDAEACDGCGACVDRCIFDAREMAGGEPRLDRERCLGCGQCALVCPAGAVRLQPDGARS